MMHGFSGDAHAAAVSKRTGEPGWWSTMIGNGLGFDTDRYFVICSNVLGGCQGTTVLHQSILKRAGHTLYVFR